VTSELFLQQRYSQAVRDDTGQSFAAITEPGRVDAAPGYSLMRAKDTAAHKERNAQCR